MKTKIIIVVLLMLGMATTGFSQFSFGVSPGLQINGAWFGYRMGEVVPAVGLQYANVKLTFEDDFEDYSVSVSMIVPSDGEEDTGFSDIVSNVSAIGGEFGFGVEYFFDNNLSVGGEFGLRYFSVKYTEEDFGNLTRRRLI